MKLQKNYETPKVLGEVVTNEPVETGCCLRSCGGSPNHMGEEKNISEKAKAKLENAIK